MAFSPFDRNGNGQVLSPFLRRIAFEVFLWNANGRQSTHDTGRIVQLCTFSQYKKTGSMSGVRVTEIKGGEKVDLGERDATTS